MISNVAALCVVLKGNKGYQSVQVLLNLVIPSQTDMILHSDINTFLDTTLKSFFCDSNHSKTVGVTFSQMIDVSL